MGERINLGGSYQTENQDGEEVTRHRFWVEVSSSLMNRVNAISMASGDHPKEILAGIVSGDIDPDEYEDSDESDESDE